MSDIQNEILKTLKDIRKWVRFSGWRNVKDVLANTLNNPDEIVVYSMTDGKMGIRDIRDATGKGYGTIQRLWKSWIKLGIAEPVAYGTGSRAKAVFDLENFGITIPDLGRSVTQEEEVD